METRLLYSKLRVSTRFKSYDGGSPPGTALQLGTDGVVTFVNSVGLQNAGKLVVTTRLLGSFFADLGNNALNEIMRVWDGSTNDKLLLYCNHLFGGSRITFHNQQWPGDCAALDLQPILASLVGTNFYTLVCELDPAAGTRCVATLLDTDGVTVLATGGSNSNTTADPLQTTAGIGKLVMGFQGGFGAGVGMTVDYLTVTDGAILRFDAEYNEGVGASTTESVESAVGTISGTSNWVSI